MKPLKLAAILAVFCLALFFTIKIALWDGSTSQPVQIPGDSIAMSSHPETIGYLPRTGTISITDTAKYVEPQPVDSALENMEAPDKPVTSIEQNPINDEQELIKAYNSNNHTACKVIIKDNHELATYGKDIEYIFSIRRNKSLNSSFEFSSPALSKQDIAMLYADGFIDTNNRPTNKFHIKKLSDIKTRRIQLENLLKN